MLDELRTWDAQVVSRRTVLYLGLSMLVWCVVLGFTVARIVPRLDGPSPSLFGPWADVGGVVVFPAIWAFILLAGSVVLYCASSRLELMLTAGYFVPSMVLALVGFTDLLVQQELTRLFIVSMFLFSIILVVLAALLLRSVVVWVRKMVLWRHVP